jgi:hypothetical protein
MKSQLLILLLILVIVPTVLLNVLYLQRVVSASDPETDGDSKPILQKVAPPPPPPPPPQEKRQSPKSKGNDRLDEKTGVLDILRKEEPHRVAGLNCETYGGPSEGDAAEMVYWRDIPSDANFKSPYATYGPETKNLTFEPDEGGWNNIRMSMETAVVLAQAMGRTLVCHPSKRWTNLNGEGWSAGFEKR